MRRLRDVRLPPLAWVAIAAAVSAVVRFLVALQVQTPLYYPDEYRATALARSIAEGGLPRIRGEFIGLNFTSYAPSLAQAPAWLISDVDVAYRVAQALGSAAFAAAGVGAYFLARQLRISERGAILVAVLALAVPAGALTATLLAEPYAYPAFLFSVGLAVRALAHPALARQLGTVAAAGGLCLIGGLQFVFFGAAFVTAWVVSGEWSARALGRRVSLTVVVVTALVLVLSTVAQGRFLDVLVSTARVFDYSPRGIGEWYVVNMFVLAIGAGWVLVPGAVLGLRSLAKSAAPTERAFGLLSILLLVFVLAEAAVMSERYGLHERFTFYAAPLIAVAFVWWTEHVTSRRRSVAAVAYLAAFLAVLLPINEPLDRTSAIHAPTLIGLSQLDFGGGTSGGVWAPVLVALALLAALYGAMRRRQIAVIAVAMCVVVSGLTSRGLLRLGDETPPVRLNAPDGATLLTWPDVGGILLDKTLFWNPEVKRVALFGTGRSPDDYAFIQAHVSPEGLVDGSGQPVPGPYVLGPEATAVTAVGQQESPGFAVLRDSPSLLAFGWYPDIGSISDSGIIVAAAGRGDRRIVLRLHSRTGRKTISIRCDSLPPRTIEVRSQRSVVTIPVSRDTDRACSFRLVRGSLMTVRERAIALEASLRFVR